MLAFLVSVKQRRCPKTRARPITHYHAYRKYTECLYITDTSVFRTRSAAVVLATVLATNNIRVFTIYVIIASFYIFYASSVALTILLLKKPSNWSKIWTRIYYNNTFKRLPSVIFVFKQFLIGLKQNLREEDNLSTRDKWPVPKVSSFRRFYCSSYHTQILFLLLACMHVITQFTVEFDTCNTLSSIWLSFLLFWPLFHSKYHSKIVLLPVLRMCVIKRT